MVLQMRCLAEEANVAMSREDTTTSHRILSTSTPSATSAASCLPCIALLICIGCVTSASGLTHASSLPVTSCVPAAPPLPAIPPAPIVLPVPVAPLLLTASPAPATLAPHEFQSQVLWLLNIVRLTVQEILSNLDACVAQGKVTSAPAVLVQQPFETVDALLNFEASLGPEDANVLINELVQLGGRNPNAAVKRMLIYLFADKLAAEYSWHRKKGKRKYADLRLSALVHCCQEALPTKYKG
ncbi:uncharacterized protein LOC142559098 isoform X2 [Dermacentor variabilis]|uniref:uncharacterized protein LOC142559098 isoform X2 n=1 Tax=Dermacentor variabilis TaxID=34621 RepID=UPI003F5CB59A